MALFNEGVSVATQDRPNSEGMDVTIGEGLSAEAQAKLKAMAEQQRSEEPTIELPSAEDMDLEKPLLPPVEVAPATPSVSSDLAETALSSALQSEAEPEAKQEKEVDHRRHDSSRQHAGDVHQPRTDSSKRSLNRALLDSNKALERLESTYGLNYEETPAPEAAASAPVEASATAERPKPQPPKQEQAKSPEVRPVAELKPRQQNVSDNHHEDTLQASQRPAEKAMPRKEFVKQQEELWGAKDKIAPEDVPEGELTYEQYLAQRPKAEEGDYYHVNGNRIYDAVTGTQVKRAEYEEEKLHENTNKARDDHYEEVAVHQAHEAALEQNEKHDAVMSDIVRDHVEGEVLIRKDPHLQGLYDLGKELQTLYNSKARGKKFERNVKGPFEAKEAIFNDLFQLYSEKGYDARALGFISDRTHANIEDPDVVPIEDSTFYNGDKVKVVDFVETEATPGAEAQKTYTIEHDDGLVETVDGNEVDFKRDYNPEKERTFDRVKNFFKREGRKLREYGGKAYFAGLWTSTAGNWLTNRHITENMTEEEVQAQKLKNRRNNIIGATVAFIGTVVAVKTGIFVGTSLEGGGHEALIHTDAGSEHINGVHDLSGHEAEAPIHTDAGSQHVEGVHDPAGHEAAAAPRVEVVPIVGDPNVHTEVINGSSTEALLSNAAYNIPDGGSLDQVFGSVGVNPATWQQHAQELYVQYPNVFYNEGGDIRIANPGWLPEQVRATIESFKG